MRRNPPILIIDEDCGIESNVLDWILQIGGKNEQCSAELLKRTLDNIRRDKCFDCLYNTNTEEQKLNNSVF